MCACAPLSKATLDANHAFVNDYATLRDMLAGMPLPASYEDERRWLDQQSSYTRGEYQFAVEDGGGDLVGRCGLTRVDWKNRLGEIGMMIGAPYRGRGYGTEALGLLCDFAFSEMNLHKLKVSVFAFNAAAIRCYEKNGFTREGLLRAEIFRAGRLPGRGGAGAVCPGGMRREKKRGTFAFLVTFSGRRVDFCPNGLYHVLHLPVLWKKRGREFP